MNAPRYSFVVPVFNERETLAELERRLREVMDGLDGESEVIFVDDGSTDGSDRILLDANARDPRFKVVRLSRNFGHQIAITAGLDHAAGDAVLVLDADLQDPPELAHELIARWREGFQIVYAVREDRAVEPFFRRHAIALFYRLLRRLTNIDIPVDAGDFRLVDRRALDEFKRMRETNRYVRGMFAWTGFPQTGVPYKRQARFAGETKYPYRKLLKLAADGLVSFSDAPLRLALAAGFLVALASFVFGLVRIALRLADVGAVPGWSTVVVVVSFLGGIQLIVIGVIGLYVGRIYAEVKQRPLYVVREALGFGSSRRPEVAERSPSA